jgi:hypothetical protein
MINPGKSDLPGIQNLNAIKPVPPTLGGALRRDQGQIIDFEIKKYVSPLRGADEGLSVISCVELRELRSFRPVGNFLDYVSGNPRSSLSSIQNKTGTTPGGEY